MAICGDIANAVERFECDVWHQQMLYKHACEFGGFDFEHTDFAGRFVFEGQTDHAAPSGTRDAERPSFFVGDAHGYDAFRYRDAAYRAESAWASTTERSCVSSHMRMRW